MSAWCRFARLVLCLLITTNICFTAYARSLDSSNALRLKKLETYSHITAVAIYNWNEDTEIDNRQIVSMLESAGIQNDDSSEGIIFRHLLATGTANETVKPRLPIYVKHPLLKEHWEELKVLNAKLFSAAKAYYIYARAVNDFDGSAQRITTTVPALRRLKLEALDTGDRVATAIASIWLSMELTLASPIQAINEIEYALAYLPTRSSTLSLENALDSSTAHQWLRVSYTELSVPSRAYFHSMKVIEERTQNDGFVTWAYYTAVDALILQGKYEDALLLSDKALESVKTRNLEHETYLTLYQRLRLLVTGFRQTHKNEIKTTIERIDAIDTTQIEIRVKELLYQYQSYKAIAENDEKLLSKAIEQYKKAMLETLPSTEFRAEHLLRKELELTRIYDAAGNYEKAYEHSKAYNQLLVKKNTEQFKLSSPSLTDGIARDIALARYRQQELAALRDEKIGLSTDKEALKTTIFALITTILIILALWLWIAKRQSDTLAERDSLTGALTRRAMLKSLKKALKSDSTSCVALLDVDNFKKINDRYGHLVGDEVLTTLTQTIQKRIRKSDKLCRYGGEEFLIYFSDTDQQSAKRILDELNASLSRQKLWSGTDQKFSVSFSSGLLDVNGETNLDTIIKACDDLLYKAKREGRARVAAFSF
ncbi:response regulator receiver modulated diguanylate cyclase [Alteromonas mediterranea U7]|nr:response regulator receiver modulated diguanylate cyclase [Alteromonas mediterranea U4]AGP89114.1 response regulator receiver modulated diguanylate cyclase [Alteromonas mediterranea U7]AGP92970.1 response regulator receiver modulated diguanylate cyclase [Alteromonas mediterranea U8]